MQTYPQRVRDNILPLSIAGTLPEAFKEWHFTEITIDHEKAEEECKLCNQEQIRYHFEIKNKFTQKTLWVGSQCILKFQVSVYENGVLLDSKESKKKLNKLTQKMRLESCFKALTRLAKKENNPILSNALEYYTKNKYLTPKFAFVVLWKLDEFNIDHSPSFFKINLRRDNFKYDLQTMALHRVHRIWPALSSSQRQMAIRLGHSAPNST